MTKKFITAQFFINPQDVAAFCQLTVELIANTRKEEGCLFYNLYQSLENECDFIFYEEYQNQAAIDHHLSTSHYLRFAASIKNMQSKTHNLNIF